MNDQEKTSEQLIEELAELRRQVAEFKKTSHEKETETALLLQAAPLGIHECDTDERKRVEKALRESERTLRTLMDASPESFLLLDSEGTILFANQTTAHRLYRTVDTIIGRKMHDVLPSEVAANRLAYFNEVVRTGKPIRFEDERFDRHIENAMYPVIDQEGNVATVAVLGIDQTERKRTEQALQQAHDELERRVEERTAELTKANEEIAVFHRFVEASKQGFAMARPNGQITYVNPAISRLLAEGRPEDVIGNHVSKYYPKEFMEKREEEILPSLLREGHWEGEVVISHPHGLTPFLYNSFLVRDEQGEPAYLAAVMTDITERRQAEAALQQSRDELQAIYDGMIDGLLLADMETKQFVRVNASVCRMLGYSKEELLSMSVTDIHPPKELPTISEAFEVSAEHRVSAVDDLPVLKKDGSVFFAQIATNTIVYNGRPCVIGFFRDVTERKYAQEQLQREHRTLKHLLQSSDHERQLIAYEIHDGLAQQLAGAIMQFETYFHQKDAKAKEAAKAYDAAMTMLRQGHFEARRLISGVRPPILDESGVVAAIAHLVSDQSLTEGAKVEFRSKVDFDRLAPTLENSIYRIAQEGLANTCQHSKSKKVKVSLLQRDDHVRIEIRDWGIGFDPKKVREGCYGLVGIRQRARLLGGKSSIRSKAGKGTRIVVELPVAERE
jgi:PAS domain S-box-containing protein